MTGNKPDGRRSSAELSRGGEAVLDPMTAKTLVSLHQHERMEQAAWARVVAAARRARGRRPWWRSLMWPSQWRLPQHKEAVCSV